MTLQSNRAHEKVAPSTWAVTKEIIKKEGFGIRGLNKGLLATLIRNGIHNMCFLGLYHSLKLVPPEYEDPWKEFFRMSACGFLAGTLGSCANIPFDVTKSRIQGPQPQPGVIKYRTTFGSMSSVYKEEGWRALYKGLLAKLLRLGPGGSILVVVYDYTYNYLSTRFPD